MQACQYIKTQEASTGLGLVNKNTTWEINNLADDKFQFVVTYKDGEGGRYVTDMPRQLVISQTLQLQAFIYPTNNICIYHRLNMPTLYH